MKIFSWITKDTNINFMGARKWTYAISGLSMILAVFFILTKSFNYGIDFSGGILMEVKDEQVIDLDKLRAELSHLNIGEINIQTIGETGQEVMIRAQAQMLDEREQMKAVNEIKRILGNDVEIRKVELVGPQVGDELKRDGILASVIAVIGISLYIWFRFEWQFALGAMIGLVHDILVTVGLLSLFQIDFSLTTVAAILTLAGYSVNDTVVTYDRIRENLRKYKTMPQVQLLNKSINDIFSRTLLTGFTTLLASIALLIWGGDALRSFSFTLVWGILIGTYSSIYVSTVILDWFDLRKSIENREKEISPFGNVG